MVGINYQYRGMVSLGVNSDASADVLYSIDIGFDVFSAAIHKGLPFMHFANIH